MDSTQLPFELTRYFTPDDLQRSTSWMFTENVADLVELAIDLTLLWTLSLGAPGRRLWSRLSARFARPEPTPLDRILGADWRTAGVFLGVVALVRNVIAFPVALYVQYFQAHRIGLSHESLLSFVRRGSMRAVAMAATGAILGAVLGAVRRRWPRRWWLVLGVSTALMLVADTTIEPLFQHIDYKVRPLEPGPVRTRIEALLTSQHASVGDIVTIDASRYGTEANAFVSGFGPTRRLVLTDTLLKFGDEAVIGAVAHEIGHRRDQRLPGRLAFAGLGMIVFLGIVELALRFADARGARHAAQGLPFVMITVALLMFVLSPIRASFNRDEEREADALELSIRHDYDAYIDEQVRLARANASAPQPPTVIRLMMSHPTTAERIGRALWYKQHAAEALLQATPRP